MLGLLLLSDSILGQDLEAIKNGEILSANGGISFSQIAYNSNRPLPARKPYTYMLNGNVNLKILGFIDAPFVFIYSNLGNKYTQPTFNQSSLHPKYKWAQLHLGTINTSWSPYTLNGHVFNGGSFDLTPGNFSISGVYGRFVKPTSPEGVVGNSNSTAAFGRNGAGIKLGWQNPGKTNIAGNVFYAADNLQSLIPDSFLRLSPQENLSMSLNSTFVPIKWITFHTDLGLSILNEDRRISNSHLLKDRKNYGMFRAVKLNMDLALGKNMITTGYERIDPGYKTLGAYYFNNDLENFTLGIANNFFKNKLRLQGNIGKQRDNLNEQKLNLMRRTVGNITVQYQHNKHVSISTNYSNFLSYSNLRTFNETQNNTNIYAQWDTLNYRQISQNLNTGVQWILKQDSIKQRHILLNGTAQTAADRRNGVVENGSLFVNALFAVSQQNKRSGISFTISASLAHTELAGIGTWFWAPATTVSLPLAHKQYKWSSTLSFTQNMRQSQAGTLNLRTQLSGTFAKVHQLSLSAMLLRRSALPAQALRESTLTLVYSVNTQFFDLRNWRKQAKNMP
ncbi:MAG: hypothetical protein IT244_10695 [Bacteroidia bacterium]|nr:hypothetical protein [Bacteroidia bacterium]